MRKKVLLGVLTTLCVMVAYTQSAIYYPNIKTLKPSAETGLLEPESLVLLLEYPQGQPSYNIEDIDLLDSVYRVAFSKTNPMMYTFVIEGYGTAADKDLVRSRVDGVYNYFTGRCDAQFMIRIAPNPISSSCSGDSVEMVRYEVPTDRKYYDMAELPQSKQVFNKIPLLDKVKITITNNPKACIGDFEGCSVPSKDSIIRSYYSSVTLAKGSLLRIKNTKDKCPDDVEFSIEEHLNYREILDKYFLVPHKRQIIIQTGFIVLHSNYKRDYNECSQALPDSIFVTFPVTQVQLENKIRIFAKKYTDNGAEYKGLPTKKLPSKVSLSVQAKIDPTQIDTIFLGKRIKVEEADDYFYKVKTDAEEGTITIGDKYYKPYRIDKEGNYELKKPLRALFRMENDAEEEEIEESKIDKKYADDEEIE
jgi:hypothetical protein